MTADTTDTKTIRSAITPFFTTLPLIILAAFFEGLPYHFDYNRRMFLFGLTLILATGAIACITGALTVWILFGVYVIAFVAWVVHRHI